ncbi:MAG: hypothetical protein HND57_00815 [Planctomycetes bacterium]|nr:hypothetical protein [Planctomycetota bacterium]
MDGVDGSHDNLPQINYSCESDVSTLSFHLGYMNFHVIDSTPYFGQWTKFTWVIGDDGTIDYFINDELLVSSEAGMAAPLFGTEATLAIRGRSVGTTILNDDTVVFVPPPDYDLTLHEPLPGIAGGPNSFQVSECTFGETVVLKYSLKTGTADIAGCPGIYFELDSPKLVGSAVANYFGDAWITVPIPGVASGLTVHLQAYEKGTCLISNPLEYTFE